MDFKATLRKVYDIVLFALGLDKIYPETNISFWWVDWFIDVILGG